MNKQLYALIIIAILGIALVMGVYGTDNLFGDPKPSSNPADAPLLTDLFPDRVEGPHQKFTSEEKCLVCHTKATEIPGMGTAPQIAHEFRINCTSCHRMKRN